MYHIQHIISTHHIQHIISTHHIQQHPIFFGFVDWCWCDFYPLIKACLFKDDIKDGVFSLGMKAFCFTPPTCTVPLTFLNLRQKEVGENDFLHYFTVSLHYQETISFKNIFCNSWILCSLGMFVSFWFAIEVKSFTDSDNKRYVMIGSFAWWKG